ncbi:MAG: hypothetical protein GF375_07680 [Candidatus Omnitrophica bacterium]|nr:hypothetical protein [Candidatus Omnitrophota bacterium]
MKRRSNASGLTVQECSEPNCQGIDFRLIVGLEYPVLECESCGRRHVLIDSHTQKPVGHDLMMSPRVVKMNCPFCGGSGFVGTINKCPQCHGSGIFNQDSLAKRTEKMKEEREKLKKKDLDPDVL